MSMLDVVVERRPSVFMLIDCQMCAGCASATSGRSHDKASRICRQLSVEVIYEHMTLLDSGALSLMCVYC
jgi:hypothetical protein